MLLFWVACSTALPLLGVSFGQEHCRLSKGNHHHDSPVLKTLQCHNDYRESIFCDWLEDPRKPLDLYNWNENGTAVPCVPYGEPKTQPGGQRTGQCCLKAGLGIFGHTFFFKSPCPPRGPNAIELSERVRVRPPVNLSEQPLGDGGQLFHWSSPYPSMSPLTSDLTYQLSYRKDTEDFWVNVTVSDRHVKLEAVSLEPGCGYQARVRARGKWGLWSEWSPQVVWQTKEATGYEDPSSSLQCVLDGDSVVTCGWELITERAHFITYHLACRNNRTAPTERCCVNMTISAAPGGLVMKYTCTLTHPEPWQLLLELIPTRNTKEILDYKHIKPNRPERVTVKEKEGNWLLEWTKPSSRDTLFFSYQVQHWSEQTKNASHHTSVSEGALSLSILDGSLDPSKVYGARVRALVAPGREYEGTPSEWSETVEWTSHPASWLLSSIVYIITGILVTILFLILYITVPSCHRRVKLWDVSVPSPVKSKVIADIIKSTGWPSSSSKKERWPSKMAAHGVLPQESLDISVCSSCSSNDPFLSSEHGTHEIGLHHSLSERGDWDGMLYSSSPATEEKVPLETSCMTFSSGEYFYPPSDPSEPHAPTLSPWVQGLDSSTTPNLRTSTSSSSSTDGKPLVFSSSLSSSCEDYIVLPDRNVSADSPSRLCNGPCDAVAVGNRGDSAAPQAEMGLGSMFARLVQEDNSPVFSAMPLTSYPVGAAMGCESTEYFQLPVLVWAQQQMVDLQSPGCPEGGDGMEESNDKQLKEDPYVTLKV